VTTEGISRRPPRLLCLPWAGGVAGSYAAWSDGLWPVEVLPLELPGRGRRHAEAPLRDWSEAHTIAGREAREQRRPFVLFGHSMGAVLAYELARQLESESGISPAAVIISGAAAPHCRRELLHSRMTDRELALSLVNAGGTPRELLDDADFLAAYLSLLKADLRLLESYHWRPGPVLDCPVYAIAGRDDPYAPPQAVQAWSDLVGSRFEFGSYPGGHFYFKLQLTAFLADLKRFVAGCGAPRYLGADVA
jgi:surfactin synthase thioesterase subunit